jgi:hypothetical protein
LQNPLSHRLIGGQELPHSFNRERIQEMKLPQLMRYSKWLKKELETNNDERLWHQWHKLNLHASFLEPRSDAEIKFLQERIEEYGEFIATEPVFKFDLLQAQDAVNRMCRNIVEWRVSQSRAARIAA